MSAADHLGVQFRRLRTDAYGSTHIAEYRGETVGYASINHMPGEPVEVAALRVEDEHQGKGIGRGLMHHVISEYPGQEMELEASPFANEALSKSRLTNFYGSLGFMPQKDGYMRRSA